MILNVGGCDGNHYDGWRKGVTVSGHGASAVWTRNQLPVTAAGLAAGAGW